MKFYGTIKQTFKRNGLKSLIILFKDLILRFWYLDRMKLDYSKKIISVNKLNEEIKNKRFLEFGSEYTMSRIEWLSVSIKSLPIPISNSTILDIGCGEGLTLCYFAQKGFKKVIGIEYSKTLALTARRNLKKVEKKIGFHDWDIICGDAFDYKLSQEIDIIWMFNPFRGKILEKVLSNIAEIGKKKNIYLIIANPPKENITKKFLKRIRKIRNFYPKIYLYETLR